MLNDTELRLLRTMVERSAAVVAPEEYEDDFEDYVAVLEATRTPPGLDPRAGGGASAGILDVDIFLGMGLALLGQTGLKVLETIGEMAIERGARNGMDLARRLFRRRSAAVGEQPTDPDVVAVLDALTQTVRVAVVRELPITTEQLRLVVTIQVQAIADAGAASTEP
jgi:hypothetical protein